MEITTPNLQALNTGFSGLFQNGVTQVESQWDRVAMQVPSTTSSNTYGWLKELPNLREWFGERVIHGISESDYVIKNRDFELTVGVNRNSILDDEIGVYNPIFQHFGQSVGAHPNQLVFNQLAAGFDTECFDGQNYFDTDHPLVAEDGSQTTVSNTGGGAGTPWFLLDMSKAIKPMIYQKRQDYNFVAIDDPTDQRVFMNKEFTYGTDGRSNVGYGFWQMAYGSRQPLNAANYEAARVAMHDMKGEHGRKLGITPTLLVVPTSLEGAAMDILSVDRNAAGATNKWKGTAELLLANWL